VFYTSQSDMFSPDVVSDEGWPRFTTNRLPQLHVHNWQPSASAPSYVDPGYAAVRSQEGLLHSGCRGEDKGGQHAGRFAPRVPAAGSKHGCTMHHFWTAMQPVIWLSDMQIGARSSLALLMITISPALSGNCWRCVLLMNPSAGFFHESPILSVSERILFGDTRRCYLAYVRFP